MPLRQQSIRSALHRLHTKQQVSTETWTAQPSQELDALVGSRQGGHSAKSMLVRAAELQVLLIDGSIWLC